MVEASPGPKFILYKPFPQPTDKRLKYRANLYIVVMLETTLDLLVLLFPHVYPNLAAIGRLARDRVVT